LEAQLGSGGSEIERLNRAIAAVKAEYFKLVSAQT
jgi:hypothetical protein